VGQLRKIELDTDLSSNPQVRDLSVEMFFYLRKNRTNFSSSQNIRTGRITQLDLTSPPDALKSFVDEFLSDDAPGQVYTLLYD
jgi:hypothetical protein